MTASLRCTFLEVRLLDENVSALVMFRDTAGCPADEFHLMHIPAVHVLTLSPTVTFPSQNS